MKRETVAAWRDNFFAGLAVVLPGVVSVTLLVWVFQGVAGITDLLLFFLPHEWTHQDAGRGPMYWYWSLAALVWALVLVTLIGRFTRYYIGRRLVDLLLLRVPLLNKIYGTIKQVNEAFSSNKKSAFRQVVLVEFPRAGQYSI